MAARVSWCVEERDTGVPCASGSAPTIEYAKQEMMRYAFKYAQDSPVRYWMRRSRKILTEGDIEMLHTERPPGCGHTQGRGAT